MYVKASYHSTSGDHHYYETHPSDHQHDGPSGIYGNNNLSQGNCQLPSSWKGKWFQSGMNLQILEINNKSITTKGVCIEGREDKFLFYDPSSQECKYKCLVINERHRNVLQYKESECESEKDVLENLCEKIIGDAVLFSLFRLEAEPVECPFRGAPFNFTYNRGHGECKDPVSRVDSCTENSKLLFRFEACPNVDKTESKWEELECLAHWRDGSNNYLIGKLDTRIGTSNYEEKFRCFIFERIKERQGNNDVTVGYRVAQSGDATCTGVNSATDGARALTLTKVDQGNLGKCKFPSWVTTHHWHTLDGKVSLKFHHHRNTTLHITDDHKKEIGNFGYHGLGSFINRDVNSFFNGGSRMVCQSRTDVSNSHVSIVAHHAEGCKSETVCLNIYKRDSHVIEVKIHKKSAHKDGDCTNMNLNDNSNVPPYMTLISGTIPSHRCPNLGKYMATGVTADGRVPREICGVGAEGAFTSLIVGCGDRGTMEFHSKCPEPIAYTCHGSWREGDTGYLIASRSSTSARRFCFIYTLAETGLRVSQSQESCHRNINPGIEGNWAFNVTVDGQCAERLTSGASGRVQSVGSPFTFISVILLLLTLSACTSACLVDRVRLMTSR